jgi:hypothetical protein
MRFVPERIKPVVLPVALACLALALLYLLAKGINVLKPANVVCRDYPAAPPQGIWLKASSYEDAMRGIGKFSAGPMAELLVARGTGACSGDCEAWGQLPGPDSWIVRRGFLTFGPFAQPVKATLVLTLTVTQDVPAPDDALVLVHPGQWGGPLPLRSDLAALKWTAFDAQQVLGQARIGKDQPVTLIPLKALPLDEGGYVNLLVRLGMEVTDRWQDTLVNVTEVALRECGKKE